jgi:hypothetical protein
MVAGAFCEPAFEIAPFLACFAPVSSILGRENLAFPRLI